LENNAESLTLRHYNKSLRSYDFGLFSYYPFYIVALFISFFIGKPWPMLDNRIKLTYHVLTNRGVELTSRMKYKTREEARRSNFEYTGIFYNRKRLHSTLRYRSPVEYEKLT
jgi:putative transposase